MKKEDIREIKHFTKKFEAKFNTLLELRHYKVNEFRDYINYGAETIYTIPRPKDFEETKWQREPREGMIWISTGINPNGITSKHDIDRDYTIQFEQRCSERLRYGRIWREEYLYKFYGYGRTMDEIMDKFQEFLNKIK